jgi:hypothetical protein
MYIKIDEIKSQIKKEHLLYNKCPQMHIRLVSNARRISVIFNYTPININGVFNILKVLY